MYKLGAKALHTSVFSVNSVCVPSIPSYFFEGEDALAATLKHLRLTFAWMPQSNLDLICSRKEKRKEEEKEVVLSKLLSLNLGYNRFTYIPADMGQMKNLTVLLLNDNQLNLVPEEILALKNLTDLVLSANQIECVPDGFWSAFPNLYYLSLRGNQLSRLSPSIYRLPRSLAFLQLSSNKIREFPVPDEEYWDPEHTFDGLHVLALGNNQLERPIPREFMEKAVSLQLLELCRNRLKSFCADECAETSPVGRMPLLSLNLSHNDIENIDFVQNIPTLTSLDVSKNQISQLPEGLCSLQGLVRVAAEGNQAGMHVSAAIAEHLLCRFSASEKKEERSNADMLQFGSLSVDRDVFDMLCDQLEPLRDSRELVFPEEKGSSHDTWWTVALHSSEGQLSYTLLEEGGVCVAAPLTIGTLVNTTGVKGIAKSPLANHRRFLTASGPSVNGLGPSIKTKKGGGEDMKGKDSEKCRQLLHFDDEGIAHVPVYTQWDSGACGYHALKNALFALLAMDHLGSSSTSYASGGSNYLDAFFALMQSPSHYWALRFHLEHRMLALAASKRNWALNHNRTHDVVWKTDSVRGGIVERNYVRPIMESDLLQSSGVADKILPISELAYIRSDTMSSEQILKVEQFIQDFVSPKKEESTDALVDARAFLVSVNKNHWVTLVAVRFPRASMETSSTGISASGSFSNLVEKKVYNFFGVDIDDTGEVDDSSTHLRFIVANSSFWENPESRRYSETGERTSGHSRHSEKLNKYVQMLVDCLRKKKTFGQVYLERKLYCQTKRPPAEEVIKALTKDTSLKLLDPQSKEERVPDKEDAPTAVSEWYGDVYCLLAGILSKVSFFGPDVVSKASAARMKQWLNRVQSWENNKYACEKLSELLAKKRKGMDTLLHQPLVGVWKLPLISED